MDKPGGYHHGDLRQALIEASLALIEEGGVQALSLRKAARRAGVSPGAPYHHFPSRGALLAAISIDGFTRLLAKMNEVRACCDGPQGRLGVCGRAYVEFAREHPAHFRVMFRPELADRDEFPEIEAVARPVFEVLVQTVREAQDEGLMPAGDTEAFVVLAWSVAHGLSSLLLDGPLGGGHFDKIQIEEDRLADVVLEAFARTLRAAAGATG